MGRGPEEALFQRRCTDGQQAGEKTLSVTDHQGNASPDEITAHTCQDGHCEKDNR